MICMSKEKVIPPLTPKKVIRKARRKMDGWSVQERRRYLSRRMRLTIIQLKESWR